MSKNNINEENGKNIPEFVVPEPEDEGETEELDEADDAEKSDNITENDSAEADGSETADSSEDDDGESAGECASVLKDDSDTDKMASILEEDVTAEIIENDTDDDDDELTVPREVLNSRAGEQAPQVENDCDLADFNEIKNNADMKDFETPYTYTGKNGKRIRYRLSLPNNKNPKKKRLVRDVIGYCAAALAAVILAVLVRSYVFVIATVDGPSMEPTLYSSERIIVTRYTYRLSEIKRGDIIVCSFPSPVFQKNYIKRVIALGGEKIAIKNGIVYINGEPLKEDYITVPAYNDMEEQFVPEGYVFVIGDNRNNSSDSRKASIGPIPESMVIGKAQFIVYPFSKIGNLYSDAEATESLK